MSLSYIIGYAGAILILFAYYLSSTKKVTGDSLKYQLLNLFGAVGLVINGFTQAAWPSVVLNVIWGVIALKTLMMIKKSA